MEIARATIKFYENGLLVLHAPHVNRDALQDLMGCELDAKLDKHRKKKSLRANNYAWEIMTQIAHKLGQDVDEIYHQMLVKYGQNCIDEDGGAIVFSMLSDRKPTEIFYIHSAPIGYGEINGKTFTHYRMLRGSSSYDSKEMSILIDGIVSDAQTLGIETMPEAELKSMCERCGK